MTKILEAQDILSNARSCVECVFLAAGHLPREECDPIQAVADIASGKIDEAIALLDKCRKADDASLVAVPPSAMPASRARTKRKGK